MILCSELNKQFHDQEQMFKALIANKSGIITLKKSVFKESDGFSYLLTDDETKKGLCLKANEAIDDPNITQLATRVIMNTTNIMDSHKDVHIDNIWKRSLKASAVKIHLQEHSRSFDKVIDSAAKAYIKTFDISKIDPDYSGSTQALMFDSIVKQSRNPEMFKQYKNGWVDNHSVGMQYVDLVFCVNSSADWAKEEKDNWDKYYPSIINKEVADVYGYFYAVIEAKLIEGSAVLFGSNSFTPTMDNNLKSAAALSEEDIIEPPTGTQAKGAYIFNPNLF